MAKIALRAYHQTIEKMIDNGQLEEAVAHCQYILKTFPKSLETYRVLGRAFLEQHHFDEAADIFQRVLLAVPDDFIGNLGMSLVREEQKNLDGAIYHMERAYDVQSANAAIQGELRRLYGRRDGMEPPKIRLSRGALANMYAKGEQFDQAVLEIRSMLGEEASRSDMQVLLARVYYRAGKRVEATELCNALIKKYPFTLDANRIMAEVLTQAGRTDSAQPFRQRVYQLDPYAGYVTGSLFDSDKVADAAVTLEKYDWQPGETPAWTARVATTQPMPTSPSPVWTSEPEPQRPAVEEAAPAIPTSDENIPDWMKQAGWGTSTGAFQEGPVNFDEPEETPAQAAALDELATADIPDWLKAIAPSADEASDSGQATSTEAEADMDFLSNLGVPVGSPPESATPAPAQAPSESFDWSNNTNETPATPEQPQAAESFDWLNTPAETPTAAIPAQDVPDWMKGPDEPQAPSTNPTAAQPADEIPDWMKGFGEPQAQPANVTPAEPAEDIPDWMRGGFEESQPTAKADDTNDWLASLSASTAPPSQSSDDMDWLKNLGEPETPAPQETQPSKPAPPPMDTRTKHITGWLRSLDEEQPAAQEESAMPDKNKPQPPSVPPSGDELSSLSAGPGTSSSEQDDALAWLESLAAKQGAKSEELLTKPGDRLEAAPDWVSQVGEQPAAPVTPAEQIPTEATPAPSSLGMSSSEQDDALAWLESLAAKQGAKSEELLTKPGDRLESAPDWVNKVGATPEPPVESTEPPAPYQPEKPIEAEAQPASELSPMASGPGMSSSEQDDALAWLESLAAKQGAKSEELITKPTERHESAPDWVGTVKNKPTQTSPLVSAPGTQPAEQDQSMAWLENLAAKQGAQPEELITKPEERASDELDWLGRLGEEEEPPQPVSPTASTEGTGMGEDDAFAWLEALAAKQGAKSEELLTKPEERREEKPDWVANVPAETAQAPAPEKEESDWFTPESEKAEEQPWFTPEADKSTEESDQPWFTPEPEKAAEPEQPWFTPVPEPEPVTPEPQPVAAEDDITAWLHQLDEEDKIAEAKPVAEQIPVEEEKPEFLSELETHTAQAAEKELPEWLRGDLEEKTPAPVTPSEWTPEEPTPVAPAPVQTLPQPEPVAHIEETPQAAVPAPTSTPVKAPRTTGQLRASKRDVSYSAGTKENDVFLQARAAMNGNNLRDAITEYSKLIKRGRMLEEVIGDLRDATYRYPVDVVVWQTLGDAYMRAGRLQEALNSYTKAEELLR